MNHIKRLLGILMVMLAVLPTFANGKGGDPNIKDVVLEHIKDSYDWHITNIGDKPLVIHLPIIVNSSTGFHDVPVEQIRECQNQFLDAMRSSHNDILDTLADGQLSDEVIKVIEDTMANVVGQYKG